jgi:hypothetical protein
MLNPQVGEPKGLSTSRPEKSPEISPSMDNNDEAQSATEAFLSSDNSPDNTPLHSALQQGNETLHGKKLRHSSSAETAETTLLAGFEADHLGEKFSVLKRVHDEKSEVSFDVTYLNSKLEKFLMCKTGPNFNSHTYDELCRTNLDLKDQFPLIP